MEFPNAKRSTFQISGVGSTFPTIEELQFQRDAFERKAGFVRIIDAVTRFKQQKTHPMTSGRTAFGVDTASI